MEESFKDSRLSLPFLSIPVSLTSQGDWISRDNMDPYRFQKKEQQGPQILHVSNFSSLAQDQRARNEKKKQRQGPRTT